MSFNFKAIIVGCLILMSHSFLQSQSLNFEPSDLAGETITNQSSIYYGPDNKLFDTQQDGIIFDDEVSRAIASPGDGNYAILDSNPIVLIKNNTPHYNDDATPNSSNSSEEVRLSVVGTDSRLGSAAHAIANFKKTMPDVPMALFRINAGGPELTYNNEIFSADANFIGGKIFENTQATVTPMFQTERSASPPTFEYAFNVPNGDYEVILHFAEIFFGATGGGSGGTGNRVFDVDGEGIKLLDDYDIFADVGAQTEVSKTFLVSVIDGELNLLFDAAGGDGVDQPKVAAIEILSAVQYPTIVVDPITNQNNEVADVISTFGVTASGGNPSANFTFEISGEPDGISIDPTTGLISGTIAPTAVIGGAGENGTHQVIVTVGKPGSTPMDITFNWIITGPDLPFTMDAIVDQQNIIGSSVSLLANATGGDIAEPITFSISGQPSGLAIDMSTGEISGIINAAALSGGTNNDGIHLVTVTANRQGSTSVQEQFIWTVTDISCTWNDLTDSNVSRYQSRNGIVGDKIYVMGGFLPGIIGTDDLEIYDATNDTWSVGADLPEPLTHMAVITLEDNIWLLGGIVGAFTSLSNKVRIYNTLTDSWSDGPDLPKPIGSGSATLNNNKIHFTGGLEDDYDTDIDDHYILDLDNISAGWTSAAPMPRPRNHHSMVSINGIIYTIGGQEAHSQNNKNDIPYMESYDPNTDVWTILADLPIARSHFESGTVVHNGKIIIVGGQEESTNFNNDVTEYDPSTNTWTDFCSLPNNRMSPMAQIYNDKLIVSGGGINGTSNLIRTTQWLQLSPSIDIAIEDLANQVNQSGENISSIQVVASGGNPTFDFSYSISGQPNGITIDSGSGEISGIVDVAALSGGPNSNGLHFVTVTVSKAGSNDNQITFSWNITDLVWQAKGEVENYSIRHECSFVQVGDKFALIGGRESSDVDIFDYNLGTWNPDVSTSPSRLNHFQGVYYQGYVWAIGAFVGGNSVFPNDPIADNIWLFDTTANQWIQGPQIPEARQRGASGTVMYNDKFYVIGGNTLGHSGGFVPWFDEYDPQTGIWTTLSDAPHARDHFQATLVGDKIYVIGGAQTDQPTSNYVAEVDVYDFTTGTWSTLFNNDLPTPRDGASIAIFNEDIIVMGGGKDDFTNGVFVKGTREVTEAFDIETETWYKMPNMNFGHRSTQAITSGNGIHILAGQSSNGNIHGNMEYYGVDNPTGSPIVASQLSVPSLLSVASEGNSNFNIEVISGETGIFITSMEIIGTDASDFSISSGEITNGLLISGSSHTMNIALSGIGASRTASLVINYGNSQTAVVNLTNSPLTNPGDQSSFIGDSVSLQIEVIDDGSTYSFTAANLPEGVTLDESTGLISGTVTGAIINSPYTSRVAIVDILTSLEVSFVNFQWEVIDPTIITLLDIPEQNNFIGETVLFSASATGGDAAFPMVYAMSGEPQGVTIDSATGEITGTIDLSASLGGPNSDGVYLVTVTASRQGSFDVITDFTWTITDEPLALFRINAGGPELTYNNEIFSADANFIGGKIFENTQATVTPLFQTERSASPPTFEYAFNVPNGDYEVILHFAEIFFGATGGGSGGTGNRVFDVDGEGIKLLDDYDIFADVGAQTEVSKTFLVSVTDGELNLIFDAAGGDGVDQPKVAAIEVLSLVQYPTIAVDPIANQNNEVDDVITSLGVTASGGNPSTNFTFTISGEPDGISIDPTSGLISGTIAPTAVIGGTGENGTHQVVVTVSKPSSTPVDITFNWIITGPDLPFILDAIGNQEDTVASTISLLANAAGGDTAQPINFSISDQPSGLDIDAVTGEISGIINSAALTGGTSNDGIHLVTVTADRQGSTSVQEQFIWTVTNISCAWNDLADSSFEKIEAQSAKVGDKLYVFAGFLPGLLITDATEIYDTVNDVWTIGAPMPIPVTHAGIAVVGTDVWIVAGFAGNNPGVATEKIQIYNTLSDSWSFGPDLPAARGSGAAAFNNGKIHYFGGLLPDRLTDVGEHYVLDVNNQASGWTPVAALPNPRNHLSAASINGLVYAIGGQFGHDNGVSDQNFLDVYDPSTDAWTSLAGLPSARSHFEPGTIVHNNKIIIVGGRQGDFFFDDITEYDPITNAWTERCKLPEQLLAPASKVFGNRLIVANGGINGISNPTNSTRWLSIEPAIEFPLLQLNLVADQTNQVGDSSSLVINATGGDPNENITYSINNQPAGLDIDANNGQITGSIDALARDGGQSSNGIHLVTVTASSPGSLNATQQFIWSIGLIYNGTNWTPSAPDESTALVNAYIMSGDYTVISDMEVNNLIVQPDATLVIEAGTAITTNGDINVNGTGVIELNSTSSSYSSLIANGLVNGNVIYKRHVNNTALPGESGSNDLISPPLSGQPFNDFVTSNTNIVSNNDNTLYLFGPFNKTNGVYDIYSSTETATLDAGIGYRAASTDTSTFTFTGTVNTGSIAVPISNSGPTFQQWNLIGNPYPSYLNVGAFLSSNIAAFGANNAAIYGYNGETDNPWVVWNQAYAQSHPDDLITPGQGFFVATEAATASINFLTSMRTKGTSNDFIADRSTSSLPGFLTLSLNQNNKTYHTDFYFNPNASRGLDKGYDAQVWGGNAANFSLFSYLVEDNAGLPMAIQSVGENDYDDIQIPLGINANAGEQISISIFENTLPSTIEVYLEDQLTQTVVLLNNSDYVLTPNNALNTNGRFYLRFTDSALSSDTSTFNGLNVFSDSQKQSIVISGLITEPTMAILYDVQGRKVLSSALRLNTNTQDIDVNRLEKGIYIISIESATEKMTKKLIIR